MVKSFKSVITALLLVSATSVFGQGLSEQDRSLVDKQRNILANPGLEANKAAWTSSGGTFAIATSGSNLLIGKASGTFDASATSQYVETALTALPKGLYGQNCLAKVKYLGGDSNLTLQATDGTNVIASQALSATTSPLDVELSFQCPSSGSMKLKLLSSADAAIVAIDEAYIGQNYKIGTVSQVEYIGSLKYAGTTGCTPSGTSATYANYAADTDCATPTVTGQVSAPSTKVPAVTLANVSPGTYKFVVSTTMTASNGAECLWRMSDGTNSSDDFSAQYDNAGQFTRAGQFTAYITYTTAQTNVTVNLQHRKVSGSACNLEIDSTDHDFVVKVEKIPPSSQIVYAPNMQPSMGYAQWSTNSGTTTTSGTFINANISGSDSVRTNGGVCTTGSTANDISCKISKLPVGVYRVSLDGFGLYAADNTNCQFEISDGTNAWSVDANSNIANNIPPVTDYATIFSYTSEQSNIEFRLRYKKNSGTNGCGIQRYGGSSLTVIPLTQGIPMPVVIGATYSTEWTSFTMSITATGSNPTKGTTSIDKAMWRRVGDTMEVRYQYKQTGAGSAGSGTYLFTIPGGYSVDTNKTSVSTSKKESICGYGALTDSGTQANASPQLYDSTHIALPFDNTASNAIFADSANGGLNNSTIGYFFTCYIPISGWTTSR